MNEFKKFVFDNYSYPDIIDMWNEFCEVNRYYGSYIHYMSDFMLIMGNEFDEIFPKIEEFSLNHKYFVEDDSRHLNSYYDAKSAVNAVVEFDDMENYLIERPFDRNMEDYIEEHELD